MRGPSVVAIAAAFAVLAAGCDASSSEPAATATAPTPDPVSAQVVDRFEVWLCHVPLDEDSELYVDRPFRLVATPAEVAEVVEAHVPAYFDELSLGQYRPMFVAGGEVTLDRTADPMQCVDQAVAGAAADTSAVLVVADAEHGGDQIGGFGHADETRRYAYVGASDFHPDWGDRPPMDLVEHEIGHTLGWDHSGVDADGRYLSALDVMSNSAAPREVDSERRDAPATLAVNLLAAGWLPEADVWRAPPDGGEVQLAPSTGAAGLRLALLPLDGDDVLTVEYLVPEGLDSHLPAAGVAVHRVSLIDGSPQGATPVFGTPPYTDLLQPGDVLEVDGWVITVGDAGQVAVAPSSP